MSTKNEQHNQSQSPWTTWEDLLLSSAVKRYGLSDWSTVAMELQSRASIQTQFTAQICQNKFHDLKRRFDVSAAGEDAGDTTVPWLDELKKLRIAELREIVEGRGASIQNLNLKVKRLEEEEERERSGKDDGNREEKPDLEKDKSENETHDVVRPAKDENDGEVAAGDSVSGERSERENRSVNESNSTENRPTGEKVEIKTMINEPVQTGSVKKNDDAEGKPVQADSWNDSSKQSEEKKAENESAKMRDSVAAESKGGKDSNEAQSSASLTKKSQSSNRSGDSGGDAVGGGDEQVASESLAKTTSRDSVKNSEPLNRFLHSIRSSKFGSVFEVRLQSQNTEKYKGIIRQHVDLETVQNRVANGSYSSSTTKFYLDLLLLFNNAIVFFPKSSPESSAAYELRKLVLKSLAKKRSAKQSKPSLEPAPSTSVKIKSDPEISDPLLAKQKTSVPFTVCGRKRSSITSKPSTLNKTLKEDDKPVVIPKQDDKKQRTTKPTSSNPKEDESLLLNLKEKPVRGARSMRRSSSTRINNTTNTSAKNNTSVKTPITDNSTNPEPSTIKGSEAPKAENKKKNNQLLLKKREAADFLKRIKKSSPAKGTLLDALKGLPENNSSGSKREPREQPKKKVNERKESTTGRQKGNGGSRKRAKEEEGSPSKRNVGRPPKRGRDEGATTAGKRVKEVVEEVASKRPSKRSKR